MKGEKSEANGEDSDDDEADLLKSREYLEADIGDTSMEEQAIQILEMVWVCLEALIKIGILVRQRPRRRDRFERALQQSQVQFPTEFDISYVKQKYPKLDSEDKSWLATRLGSANAKRRQFIQYCRDHQAKLNADLDMVVVAVTAKQPESSKATTFVATDSGNLDTTAPHEEDDSMSLVSAVTGFENDKSPKLQVPSLTSLGPGGKEFECPICFTSQSFSNERSWKYVEGRIYALHSPDTFLSIFHLPLGPFLFPQISDWTCIQDSYLPRSQSVRLYVWQERMRNNDVWRPRFLV